MKIYFLGTGTSQGIPMINCECDVCTSDNPRNQRFRTHIHVEIGGYNIQVDAAQEFRIQAIRHKIPKIDLVLLTHGHADHILGFDDMRRYCDANEGDAIPVYTNQDGDERLRSIYPYAIKDKATIRGYPAFQSRPMPPVLELEGVRISSTVQSHGSFETLGLVFEELDTGKKFAYYTDCDSVSEEARSLAKNADVAVLDGLKQTPHRSHMSIPEAVAAAEFISAESTYLIHMTHNVEHESANADLPNDIQLAYDNLVLDL